ASDAEVENLMHRSSVFLSIGVEGYGIPVLEAIRLGTPVLYDGVQPAAELMQGWGAERIDAMSHEGMAQAFQQWSAPEVLSQQRAELDPEAVPTWSAFAKGVVEAFTD
ncbi:MAG: hypothetical protein WAO50_10580, partial [Candidatus Nanopelagicales bacterium]